MDSFEQIKDILYEKDASLVVCYSNNDIKEYYNDRIIDIKNILIQDPNALKGALVADKVIGKVAASLLIVAGVKKIYADVMSKLAIPFLEENGVEFEYKELVEYIRNTSTSDTTSTRQQFKYGEEGTKKFGYNLDGTPKYEQTGQFGKWDYTNHTLLGWSKSSTATKAS